MIRSRRAVCVAVLTLATWPATAGCGSQSSSAGTGTSCSITSCTVTFDRGAGGTASILGVKAELVSVTGDQVTLRLGGETISLPSTGAQGSADGFALSVTSVTKDHVVVKISRG